MAKKAKKERFVCPKCGNDNCFEEAGSNCADSTTWQQDENGDFIMVDRSCESYGGYELFCCECGEQVSGQDNDNEEDLYLDVFMQRIVTSSDLRDGIVKMLKSKDPQVVKKGIKKLKELFI